MFTRAAAFALVTQWFLPATVERTVGRGDFI
jgi:hypothetical protein